METLGQYFTYNHDIDKATDIFVQLDNQMKKLHEKGQYVEINSNTIGIDEDCSFFRISKGLTPELRQANIETLAKLSVGTYFSLPSGTFYDYSTFPTEKLKAYFDSIESNIPKLHPEDNYYREILINGNVLYYNEYLANLKKHSQGKENSRVLTYSTPQGKAMANKDEAAFVNIVFYPIIISLFIILSYMIYILVK
jgi:hypothetical protein